MDSYASAFFLLMGIGLLVSRLFSGYIVDKGYLVILVCMANLVALGAALLLTRTTSPVLFLGCGGLLGISLGALLPSYQTVLVYLADKTKRGVANAMDFIGMDSGICLSLLMGGIISQSLGMDIAYSCSLGAACLAGDIPQIRRSPISGCAWFRIGRTGSFSILLPRGGEEDGLGSRPYSLTSFPCMEDRCRTRICRSVGRSGTPGNEACSKAKSRQASSLAS